MKIKTSTITATFALTLGISFLSAPNAEAQSLFKIFGLKGASHQKHQVKVPATITKNVALLNRISDEMVNQNRPQRGQRHNASNGQLMYSVKNFNQKVDSLVWATRSGKPSSIKAAARDTQSAYSSLKSITYRSRSNEKVSILVKKSAPLVAAISRDSNSWNITPQNRNHRSVNQHGNRFATFNNTPTITRSVNTTTTRSTPTVNTNTRNTPTTTVTNDRNNDRAGNGGDRNQQGGGNRGSRS